MFKDVPTVLWLLWCPSCPLGVVGFVPLSLLQESNLCVFMLLFCISAGQNEGTLSMAEGELLSVVEEDKGDGWTRVRRNLEEEGYVPTSYIKVFLDSNAKGAMTYI